MEFCLLVLNLFTRSLFFTQSLCTSPGGKQVFEHPVYFWYTAFRITRECNFFQSVYPSSHMLPSAHPLFRTGQNRMFQWDNVLARVREFSLFLVDNKQQEFLSVWCSHNFWKTKNIFPQIFHDNIWDCGLWKLLVVSATACLRCFRICMGGGTNRERPLIPQTKMFLFLSKSILVESLSTMFNHGIFGFW